MSVAPYQSADLILKLYDLRREARMREARNWFILFTPERLEDVTQALAGPDSANFRMVATYWDMAASLVLNGAVDERMFNDANGEHIAVFSKIAPFIAGYREKMGLPHYLKHLETLVMRLPDAEQRLAHTRERLKKVAEARRAATAVRA